MALVAGNYYCDVCSATVYDPTANRQTVGRDYYYTCGPICAQRFHREYKQMLGRMGPPPTPPIEDRKGADEQRGWKMHRWWNQTYKRKKDVYEQWKVQREFRKIQRQARRR